MMEIIAFVPAVTFAAGIPTPGPNADEVVATNSPSLTLVFPGFPTWRIYNIVNRNSVDSGIVSDKSSNINLIIASYRSSGSY